MRYFAKALTNLAPGAAFTTEGDEILFWEGANRPSEEEITAEVTRLQAEYDTQEYARNRLEAYNALNQFELISDDSINGTTTHKDAILAIKAEFPKP
jgi:hypothetical protein